MGACISLSVSMCISVRVLVCECVYLSQTVWVCKVELMFYYNLNFCLFDIKSIYEQKCFNLILFYFQSSLQLSVFNRNKIEN